MKVYPLLAVGTYEDAYELVGVFSTAEKRDEFVRQYPNMRYTRADGSTYVIKIDYARNVNPIEVDNVKAEDVPSRIWGSGMPTPDSED